ncbi:MAG: XisH family protein [Cyanobacteria bacterium P01_H01_bin.21]
MSAKDVFHPVVKRALEKDGWHITHDPYAIKIGNVEMAIDLGAERLVAAERNGEKIAVEVKSFLASASAISEFHTALGQFINYRGALKRREPDRTLYLAVPNRTYKSFFQLEFPQAIIEENQVKLLVYDVQQEAIVLWKS